MFQTAMTPRLPTVGTTMFMAVFMAALAGCVLTTPLRAAAPELSGRRADFAEEAASNAAISMANWVLTSRDAQDLPFIIIDKVQARVFVFDGDGRMRGAASALLGMARGDDTVPGIGKRKLATIRPDERTTPAGRFQASLGHDFEQDILWVDYDAALSLHRVITGKPSDHRRARLESPTPLDNRISFGCINVPVAFYDTVVAPAFKNTVGIVYILPEVKPIGAVFPVHAHGTVLAKAPQRQQ